MKVFKESLVREMLFKRQDSMHDIGQSLATHFCIAYADIEEYTVMKSKISSLKKLVSFFIRIH